MSKKNMLCMVAVVVLLSMLAMAIAGKSRFPLVSKAVAYVVLPVEQAFLALGNASDGLRGFGKALTILQAENEKLKEDNAQLRAANIRMASIYAENVQLRALLDYKEQHITQTTVVAKVIARNFGDLRDCFYIDAGENKGLKRDMVVVNDGLVGVVDEVYGDYARVLMLTSPRFKIGARVLRHDSRAIGVVGGKASTSSKLRLEHVVREASLKEGDVLVTNGYSGTHPADIVIGTITETRIDSVGLLQEADVQATADVADVEHVIVIAGFTPESKIKLEQGGQAK